MGDSGSLFLGFLLELLIRIMCTCSNVRHMIDCEFLDTFTNNLTIFINPFVNSELIIVKVRSLALS